MTSMPHPGEKFPWPSEDGGAERLQTPGFSCRPPSISNATQARITTRRLWGYQGNMVILGEKNEVYLLSATFGFSRYLRVPVRARVQKVDSETLKPVKTSPVLPAETMWPGGLAMHPSGRVHVVCGRWCHKLSQGLRLLSSFRLPMDRPYNSFVTLDNGLLVMKNFSHTENALLTVLNPETLKPACPHIPLEEPSIARLSASGNTIYVVGSRRISRCTWSSRKQTMVLDENWMPGYFETPERSYGWDPVITAENVWFLDNGMHSYSYQMTGAGVMSGTPNIIRVSRDNSADMERVPVSGIPFGTITNPPVFLEDRNRVIAYDSGNRVMKAFDLSRKKGKLSARWTKKGFGCSSHMIYYPETGELMTNDYRFPGGDSVVILDVDTGREKARIPTGAMFQGVLFPAPGWKRDLYYVTFDTLSRISFKDQQWMQ